MLLPLKVWLILFAAFMWSFLGAVIDAAGGEWGESAQVIGLSTEHPSSSRWKETHSHSHTRTHTQLFNSHTSMLHLCDITFFLPFPYGQHTLCHNLPFMRLRDHRRNKGLLLSFETIQVADSVSIFVSYIFILFFPPTVNVQHILWTGWDCQIKIFCFLYCLHWHLSCTSNDKGKTVIVLLPDCALQSLNLP